MIQPIRSSLEPTMSEPGRVSLARRPKLYGLDLALSPFQPALAVRPNLREALSACLVSRSA